MDCDGFCRSLTSKLICFLSRDTKGNEKIVRTLATDSRLVYIYDQIDLLFLVIKKTRFRKVYTNA